MYFFVLCIVSFVPFSVLFVCICVMNYCHRVATQLQLNISYIISYNPPPNPTVSEEVPFASPHTTYFTKIHLNIILQFPS